MLITKRISFDAAHSLDNREDGHPYTRVHGHSFELEVAIAGEPGGETGWIVDLGEVTEALAALRDILDHRMLNEIEGLEKPTLENLCLWAAAQLKPRFSGLKRVVAARPSVGESCVYEL